jgi:[acyl-carrier-protein] S-malonyltransferase|tara:strand:+ start:237 stop:1163 length:927 start_codon:yes stop_codon:yes gene_type:complete
MFSVIFPGQGSQVVGMSSDLYTKFELIKKLYKEADEVLNYPISKLILNGPKEELDLTENTQPAIFLVGYSIFQILKEEFNIDLNKAKFFAGHSLGEYTALACAGALDFPSTLKILKLRGRAMQTAVPKGEGGMLAILGSDIDTIEKNFEENKSQFKCFIANDNSNGQIVASGTMENINKLSKDLTSKNIKNIKLSVSAPFHCNLMNKATEIMKSEIEKLDFKTFETPLISNVTAVEIKDNSSLKNLLIQQIESRVRWRESVLYMIDNGVKQFIEIGPGKVLSGLIKRIDRSVKISAINNEEDINIIKI